MRHIELLLTRGIPNDNDKISSKVYITNINLPTVIEVSETLFRHRCHKPPSPTSQNFAHYGRYRRDRSPSLD